MMSRVAKPIIFLSNFHPFITRNIVDSGVLDLIAERATVVIFVPDYKATYFKERYEKPGVIIEGVEVTGFTSARKNTIFMRIGELLLDTKTKRFHRMVHLSKAGESFKYYLKLCFTKMFAHFKTAKQMFRWLDFRFNNRLAFGEYFQKYHPDLVFATDVFSEVDLLLLKNAKKLGLKEIAMVRSWDNTTSKNYMRVVPRRLIVHNEVMIFSKISSGSCVCDGRFQ